MSEDIKMGFYSLWPVRKAAQTPVSEHPARMLSAGTNLRKRAIWVFPENTEQA